MKEKLEIEDLNTMSLTEKLQEYICVSCRAGKKRCDKCPVKMFLNKNQVKEQS